MRPYTLAHNAARLFPLSPLAWERGQGVRGGYTTFYANFMSNLPQPVPSPSGRARHAPEFGFQFGAACLASRARFVERLAVTAA